MDPNQKPSILKSRKFWIAICDAVASAITLVVTIYLTPENTTRLLVLGLVAIVQPVFVAMVNGIATEDAAVIAAKARG